MNELPAPLNEFANRLLRNGEVKRFISGLVQKGFQIEQLSQIVEQLKNSQHLQSVKSCKP